MEDKKTDSYNQEINTITARILTIEELKSFREDHRELDKEIQNFFRVYYISGLILLAAWFASPQSKPFIELAIGNGGYNIYTLLAIAGLNIVSITILLYKGILIHDIAQFMSYMSPKDSAFNYWEYWRRNKKGTEYLARYFYSPIMIIVPSMVSFFIMTTTANIIFANPGELLQRIKNAQSPNSIIGMNNDTEHAQKLESLSNEQRRIYVENIIPVLQYSKHWFYFTLALHIVPVFLIFLSLFVVPREWKKIQRVQDVSIKLEHLKTHHSSFRNFYLKIKKGILKH